MTDLRKAAEMALEVMSKEPESFTLWVEDMRQAREALRQALSQPEQESVVGMFEEKLPDQNPPPWVRDYKPKREWVGLTDESIWDIKMKGRDLECVSRSALMRFAREIEAASKEKNT